MSAITDTALIARAISAVRPRKVQNDFMVGEVGFALLSEIWERIPEGVRGTDHTH